MPYGMTNLDKLTLLALAVSWIAACVCFGLLFGDGGTTF